MLKNQKGNVVFWIVSAILAIALVFILALPGSFNLDPQKNTDDCTTNMKNIWVATNDYMLDTNKDFQGNLNILRTTKKPGSKYFYLNEEKYCPESQGNKVDYIVFGKHVTEDFEGATRHYNGIIIICPNLARFPKHILEKSFYDNVSITKLQNVMANDIDKINTYTKSNGKLKYESLMRYMNYWKNTKHTEFNACINDPEYIALRSELTGESSGTVPGAKTASETEEETTP